MVLPRSPLFPAASLTLSPGRHDEDQALLPSLPRSPLISTSTLQVYIVPAEKHLFVQGFKPAEYETRPPSLLRGSLVVRILKPNKIKQISLTFKGTQKTEWPEGIPPKRSSYFEANDLVNHSWPFYQHDSHVPNFGADIVVPEGKNDEISHLSLDAQYSAANGSSTASIGTGNAPSEHAPHGSFAASLMKMATSTTHSLSPVNSFADLTAVLSSQTVDVKPGQFPPGDYVYNFEHPLPASSPETISANFGSVNYFLEATISRSTTFKSHLTARLPIDVVRIPSDNSVEENEPIIIERDWEDQLRYEIVVASKSVVLDTYLPMSLKFVPLFGKVALHRIRVYITEDCQYYCNNKTVHRTEPTRKYLLLEHKAKKNQSLLSQNGGRAATPEPDDEVLPRELEFQMFVPSTVNKKFDYSIHPDTAVDNIQCNHWIKISLRISKQDPENSAKRKHFEISIDSPIHLFSPLAAHNNTLLPVYSMEPEFLPEYTQLPPMSPGVTAIDASQQTSQSLLSVFGNSPAKRGSPDPQAQQAFSPSIQFQHIASSMDNDDPIQRDYDMHLDSNLYRPETDDVLSAIGSPQATAFSPVASPVMSPVRSPARSPVGRPPEPSMEPPSFSIMGVTEDTLPPAYEPGRSAMSLSPLRLDASEAAARDSSPGPVGIKSKLNRSFETRGRKSSSGKSSLKSSTSSQSSKKTELQENGPDSLSSNKLSAANSRRGSVAKNAAKDPSTDITDLDGSAQASLSRSSSVSSVDYRGANPEDDIGQTLPLLSLTDTRSEPRFSVDSGRPFDPMGSMSDLVTSTRFDDNRLPPVLSHFRNPRLSKHYQEDPLEDDGGMLMAFQKSRQKSFGVIPDVNKSQSQSDEETDGSKATINQFSHSPKDAPYKTQHESGPMMSN
ncbi:hypothetical protein OXX80_002327 [Metschnikowia pulcherrima]